MANTSIRGFALKRGFASMDEERQREIARKGGQSVPDEKRSFSKDHELASEAGRKAARLRTGGDQEESEIKRT